MSQVQEGQVVVVTETYIPPHRLNIIGCGTWLEDGLQTFSGSDALIKAHQFAEDERDKIAYQQVGIPRRRVKIKQV